MAKYTSVLAGRGKGEPSPNLREYYVPITKISGLDVNVLVRVQDYNQLAI